MVKGGHIAIAIADPRSASTAVLLDSSTGVSSWRCLQQQQQQQRFERQPLGGLQDLIEKDGIIMVAMILIAGVSTLLY